ncbi:MAG: enoyl-CoA hydratase/isomerase family protein [Byssovorax sp.]
MREIRLDGPGKNSLGTAMLTFLLAELAAAAGEPVLLTGAGDAFSAGLNLKEIVALEGDAMLAFLRLLERAVAALYLYPGPTVALVNGHAIAGGCVLTLACDHRVSASHPKIKIGLNEVALGMRFPPRLLTMVTRRVPAQFHTEALLGAGLFDPAGALRVGMIDEIAEDPRAIAEARLAALAASPGAAYALTKADLRGTEDELCPEAKWDANLRAAVPVWTSPALKQKIRAMLAR